MDYGPQVAGSKYKWPPLGAHLLPSDAQVVGMEASVSEPGNIAPPSYPPRRSLK